MKVTWMVLTKKFWFSTNGPFWVCKSHILITLESFLWFFKIFCVIENYINGFLGKSLFGANVPFGLENNASFYLCIFLDGFSRKIVFWNGDFRHKLSSGSVLMNFYYLQYGKGPNLDQSHVVRFSEKIIL